VPKILTDNICICGCEEPIVSMSKMSTGLYKHGHQNRKPRNMVEVACSSCGSPMFRWPSHVKKTNICCSMKISITCDCCGVTFDRYKSQIRDKNYCSKICSNKLKLSSDETKKKMILAAKKRWLDSPNMVATMYKTKRGTPTKYNGIQMRSKLEARYAKYLDDNGIEWVYEPKRFWLEDIQTTYMPDFYLPILDEYTEVKGWDNGLEKVESFRKLGYKINIIRSKDIP